MSTSAVPAAYCELACTESCERVSSLTPVGEDILLVLVYSTEKFPAKTASKLQSFDVGSSRCSTLDNSLRPLQTNPQYHNFNFKLGRLQFVFRQQTLGSSLFSWILSLIPHASRLWDLPIALPRSFSSNARHSFASFASSTLFVLPSWETSGMAPKPLCEVVEIQICSLVLQPPRLIFALSLLRCTDFHNKTGGCLSNPTRINPEVTKRQRVHPHTCSRAADAKSVSESTLQTE